MVDGRVALGVSRGFAKDYLKPFFEFMAYLGKTPVQFLIIAVLASLPNWRKLLIGYITPSLLTLLVVVGLKYAVGRARPRYFGGVFHFQPFHGHLNKLNSFPSAETAAAMALATLLGIYLPKGRWVFWTLGVWVGLGRVFRIDHFLSDTVFGGGLGIACVLVVHRLLGPDYYAITERPDRKG